MNNFGSDAVFQCCLLRGAVPDRILITSGFKCYFDLEVCTSGKVRDKV